MDTTDNFMLPVPPSCVGPVQRREESVDVLVLACFVAKQHHANSMNSKEDSGRMALACEPIGSRFNHSSLSVRTFRKSLQSMLLAAMHGDS